MKKIDCMLIIIYINKLICQLWEFGIVDMKVDLATLHVCKPLPCTL